LTTRYPAQPRQNGCTSVVFDMPPQPRHHDRPVTEVQVMDSAVRYPARAYPCQRFAYAITGLHA
jgi:hypothetical protein